MPQKLVALQTAAGIDYKMWVLPILGNFIAKCEIKAIVVQGSVTMM